MANFNDTINKFDKFTYFDNATNQAVKLGNTLSTDINSHSVDELLGVQAGNAHSAAHAKIKSVPYGQEVGGFSTAELEKALEAKAEAETKLAADPKGHMSSFYKDLIKEKDKSIKSLTKGLKKELAETEKLIKNSHVEVKNALRDNLDLLKNANEKHKLKIESSNLSSEEKQKALEYLNKDYETVAEGLKKRTEVLVHEKSSELAEQISEIRKDVKEKHGIDLGESRNILNNASKSGEAVEKGTLSFFEKMKGNKIATGLGAILVLPKLLEMTGITQKEKDETGQEKDNLGVNLAALGGAGSLIYAAVTNPKVIAAVARA